MWKVENLGSCKTLFFLKDVRKPTTLLETFFEMLEIIQWFVATGGASSKKKKICITFRTVLWTKCLFSPKIFMLNQWPPIWCYLWHLGGNWNWMRSRRWGLHDGIIVFIRRDTRELFLSLPCEIQQELPICKSRGGPSPGTDSVSTLSFNQPHSSEK